MIREKVSNLINNRPNKIVAKKHRVMYKDLRIVYLTGGISAVEELVVANRVSKYMIRRALKTFMSAENTSTVLNTFLNKTNTYDSIDREHFLKRQRESVEASMEHREKRGKRVAEWFAAIKPERVGPRRSPNAEANAIKGNLNDPSA